jgi:hypothetical protein
MEGMRNALQTTTRQNPSCKKALLRFNVLSWYLRRVVRATRYLQKKEARVYE